MASSYTPMHFSPKLAKSIKRAGACQSEWSPKSRLCRDRNTKLSMSDPGSGHKSPRGLLPWGFCIAWFLETVLRSCTATGECTLGRRHPCSGPTSPTRPGP
jgi:hypothetical protein